MRVFLLFIIASMPLKASSDAEKFVKSFVDHYDFKAEGRYTHEYHPFILNKALDSLATLKKRAGDEGLDIAGHIIISGYEGEAIPPYRTDYSKISINDEASSKNKVGWSLRLHNRFGLMTGFLFKDFNELAAKLFMRKEDAHFEHINAEAIEIFNDDKYIFQQHAFGQTLPLMLDFVEPLARSFACQDWKDVLRQQIMFWNELYRSEAVITGMQVAATQDILFSIAFARHLLESDFKVLSYFTGADITYPIEDSVKQHHDATKNAQDFVARFTKQLRAVGGKKTVYIFNSFVDGVGKSTMLGNVKNWMRFKDNVAAYERVDNSSSQYAEVFAYNDDVYIADLPAQMSHFTYKPDGLVYVDVETELTQDKIACLRGHVREHKESYLDEYNALFDEVEKVIEKEGITAPSLYDSKQPERAFLKNLLILKRDESNVWVPFRQDGTFYLFNYYEPHRIRVLHTLAGVASHGLKNIESEQMLFFDGLRFPLDYQLFLDDLFGKIRKSGAQKVVFVDFLSMYPRSSRENVRINYLMQQMATLDRRFDVTQSLYRNFVNPSELYGCLCNKNTEIALRNNFKFEVVLRYALYDLLCKAPSRDLEGMSIPEVSDRVAQMFINLSKGRGFEDMVDRSADEKFAYEYQSLERVFGLSKEFVNVQQFSFERVSYFSEVLEHFFAQGALGSDLAALWKGCTDPLIDVRDNYVYMGKVDKELTLANGQECVATYEFPHQCRDVVYLSSFFRAARAAWYAAISNILFNKVCYNVVPTMLKRGQHDQVFLLQRKLDSKSESESSDTPRLFHALSHGSRHVGVHENNRYFLDWENDGTNFGIFSFGLARGRSATFRYSKNLVSEILTEYQDETSAGTVMPTAELYKRLCKHPKWADEQNALFAAAERNGVFSDGCHPPVDKRVYHKVREIYLGDEGYRARAQTAVRMLATLEMILKDADADIVVRLGNKEDFKAALKLFEEITLPRYFGILFKQPLFNNYDTVEPVIPWDAIKD